MVTETLIRWIAIFEVNAILTVSLEYIYFIYLVFDTSIKKRVGVHIWYIDCIGIYNDQTMQSPPSGAIEKPRFLHLFLRKCQHTKTGWLLYPSWLSPSNQVIKTSSNYLITIFLLFFISPPPSRIRYLLYSIVFQSHH